MMNSVKTIFATISTILVAAVSCTKAPLEATDTNAEKHTCEMRLVGSLIGFDEPVTKSGESASTWKDGSVVYLRMNSPMGSTSGEGVYNAEKDTWTLSYYGSLHEGMSQSCTALYVEDQVSYENSLFTFNENSAIYEDLNASYIFKDGDLVVTANLAPKTGRIRFSGKAGSELNIYGITHYTTYDLNTHTFRTTNDVFRLKVGEDGYTPYFYGYFTDTEEPNVKVWIDAKEAYTKYCSGEIFKPGQSGKLTIPTVDSHNGWAEGLYFSIGDYKFKMIAVEGGSFNMGNPDSTGSDGIVHKVTLTGFCIGETEVTNKLYGQMIRYEGSTTTSYTNLIPYHNVSGSSAKDYAKRIGKAVSANLTIPTEAQWEYAARGGQKSKGYKYSGSNIIDEVGWYSGNTSSTQDVMLKLPNELGIYDMSGNVSEVVLDKYAEYTTKDQIDPCVTTGEWDVVRGGDRSSSAKQVYYRTDYRNASYIGFRLALNWN